MLHCKDVAQRASALIDGELGLFERLQVRLHLAMCRGCDAFIRQMRATRDLTRAAAMAEEPPAAETQARIATILSDFGKGRQSRP